MQDSLPGLTVLVIGIGFTVVGFIINAIFNTRFNGASGAFWVALVTTCYYLFILIGAPNFLVRALHTLWAFAIPLVLFGWLSSVVEKKRLKEEEQMTGSYVHNPNNPIYPGKAPQPPEPRHSPGAIVALVATIALIAAGAVFVPPLVKPYVSPSAAPSRAATLLIKSTPPGASVKVDTLDRGKTPVTLKDLFAGEVLEVQLQHGKRNVKKRVELQPGENLVDVKLEP